jgi:hypothetical protein
LAQQTRASSVTDWLDKLHGLRDTLIQTRVSLFGERKWFNAVGRYKKVAITRAGASQPGHLYQCTTYAHSANVIRYKNEDQLAQQDQVKEI